MDRRPLQILRKGLSRGLNPTKRKDAIRAQMIKIENEQKRGRKIWPTKK